MTDDPPTVSFTMTHPHDVHLFRNAIGVLSAEGYRIHVFVREKEITARLLELYDIPHEVLGAGNRSKLGLPLSWSRFGVNLLRRARQVQPDLMVAEVGAVTSPVSRMLSTDSLVFMDAEHATLQNQFVYPFATRIVTPSCFWTDIGPKQVRYDGYQELAYLHPDEFTPDPSVRAEAGIGPDETLVVLRAVGWNAAHDVNAGGFDGLESVIDALEAAGATVLVSSEEPLADDLAQYDLTIDPHRMHDLLAFADLYVGESATMATESAVLGTPAVYVSTLRVGYASDVEQNYGLLFQYSGSDRQVRAIERARSIVDGSFEADWDARWRRLVADKRNTTNVVLEHVREMAPRPRREVRV